MFSRTAQRTRSSAVTAAASLAAAACLIGATGAASAQSTVFTTSSTCPLQAQVVEFDLQNFADGVQFDSQPGAVFVEKGSGSHQGIWFVTRVVDPAIQAHRAYHFEPRDKKKPAPFTSWTIDEFPVPSNPPTTGGLRRVEASDDERLIVVRKPGVLQFVKADACVPNQDPMSPGTALCQRFAFEDNPGSLGASDVAIDRSHNVFTSATAPETAPESMGNVSYVQKFPIAAVTRKQFPAVTVVLTRWEVGFGAGTCNLKTAEQPCISGVAIKPGDSKFVYFAAPAFGANGAVGELNTQTNEVRFFPLSTVGASGPRQIDVDEEGIVWVVAGGTAANVASPIPAQLVRIDPWKKLYGCSTAYCGAMSGHPLPEGAADDPFGVAIDRGGRRGRNDGDQFRNEFVGYTDPSQGMLSGNEVGLLIPDGQLKPVNAPPQKVYPTYPTVTGVESDSLRETGEVMPQFKKVPVQVTEGPKGTFLEAQIAQGGSTVPLGINPDRHRRFGTFYYTVGQPTDGEMVLQRVERITFPRLNRRPDNPRDDDDHDDDGERDDKDADKDDDGTPNHMDKDDDNDCVPNEMDDDDDGDHLEDNYDRPDRRETKRTEWGPTAGGSSSNYTMTSTSSTTLLTVVATASDLGAPLSIEVRNPSGAIVATTLATPGTALATVVPLVSGNYTVQVKNLGLSSVDVETLLISQDLPLF